MGRRIRVTIEGYGTVKVRSPKGADRDAVADVVGEAVAKTMRLATKPQHRFHPALGWVG